jgi:hypothetical protein
MLRLAQASDRAVTHSSPLVFPVASTKFTTADVRTIRIVSIAGLLSHSPLMYLLKVLDFPIWHRQQPQLRMVR